MSNFIQHRSLCLASSSPQRHMLLKNFGLNFESYSPKIDETPHENEKAKIYVERMAIEKAREVHLTGHKIPDDTIILAGDTTVFFEDNIFGKPKNAEHAYQMLKKLSGQTHQVFSGFSILNKDSNEEVSEVSCTDVRLQKLDDKILEWYINTGEVFGKAGAYSIQGLGAILIESIHGSYNNVVGFPIERVISHLVSKSWISFTRKI